MADYDPRGKLEDRDPEQPPPDTRNGIAACPAAAGRSVTDTCTTCRHVLMAHGRDGYCAICVTAARLDEMQFDPRQLIATSDHVLDDALAARKEKIWDDGYQAGIKAAQEFPTTILARLDNIEKALRDLRETISHTTPGTPTEESPDPDLASPATGRYRAAADTVATYGPNPERWPTAERERLEREGVTRFCGAPEPDDTPRNENPGPAAADAEPYRFDPSSWPAIDVTVTNGSWRGLTGLLTGGRRRQARP